MSVVVVILTVALIGVVVLAVSAPIRAARRAPSTGDGEASAAQHERARSSERAALDHDELEAARAAKYREIRDAEMDYRTGKLSPSDYEVLDAELRAEAIAILDRLEGPAPSGDDA